MERLSRLLGAAGVPRLLRQEMLWGWLPVDGLRAWRGSQQIAGSYDQPSAKWIAERDRVLRSAAASAADPRWPGMVEAERTNLKLASADFSTAWTLSGCLAFGAGSVANAAAAPDESVTADFLCEDANLVIHYLRTGSIAFTDGAPLTCSIYVKAAGRPAITLRVDNGALVTFLRTASTTTGTMGSMSSASGAVALGGEFRSMGNGWWRFSITGTLGAGITSARVLCYLNNGTGYSYQGDGVSGLYLWGAQLEEGIGASSYIPTTVAAVTRSADALRFTDVPVSGLAARGSLLAYLRIPYAGGWLAANAVHLALNNADAADEQVLIRTTAADDHLHAVLRNGGADVADVDLGAYVAGTWYPVALSWSAGALRAACAGVNGTAAVPSALPSALDRLEVGRGISTDTPDGAAHGGIVLWDRDLAQEELSALSRSQEVVYAQ